MCTAVNLWFEDDLYLRQSQTTSIVGFKLLFVSGGLQSMFDCGAGMFPLDFGNIERHMCFFLRTRCESAQSHNGHSAAWNPCSHGGHEKGPWRSTSAKVKRGQDQDAHGHLPAGGLPGSAPRCGLRVAGGGGPPPPSEEQRSGPRSASGAAVARHGLPTAGADVSETRAIAVANRLALLRGASGPKGGGAAVEVRGAVGEGGRWLEDVAGLRWLRGLPRGRRRAATPQGKARLAAETWGICCRCFWLWWFHRCGEGGSPSPPGLLQGTSFRVRGRDWKEKLSKCGNWNKDFGKAMWFEVSSHGNVQLEML